MATLPMIPGVEIFRAGTFHKNSPDEVTFSDQDLTEMVRNFQQLSAGNPPAYRATLKLGKHDPHKGEPLTFEEGNPAAGVVANLRKEGQTLKCDFLDVQPQVAKWISDKLFRTVSIECDRPSRGEQHPDFPTTKGPVLKAVALLGSSPPAVKGLAEIPMPRMPAYGFAGKRNKLTRFYFTEVNAMDPQVAAFLASKGLDPNTMDPNAIVMAWMKDCGGGAAAPAAAPAAPPAQFTADPGLSSTDPANNNPMDRTKMMTDLNGLRALEDSNSITSNGTKGGPSDLNGLRLQLQQQKDLTPPLRGTFTEIINSVEYLQQSVQAAQALSDRQAQNTKRSLVNTFCEQMTAGPRPILTPADVECDKTGEPLPHTVKARLLRADHTKVHVFSENGNQVAKTELELQMEEVRRRQPLQFSERMRQSTPGTPESTDPATQAKKQATEYAEKRNKQIARNRAA